MPPIDEHFDSSLGADFKPPPQDAGADTGVRRERRWARRELRRQRFVVAFGSRLGGVHGRPSKESPQTIGPLNFLAASR